MTTPRENKTKMTYRICTPRLTKQKRPIKSKTEADVSDPFTSVDKTKKVKQTLAVGPAGDMYAVVNKQKKANGKGSSEPKTK